MIRYATAAALGTLIAVTAVAIRIAFRNFQREARATLDDVQRTASAWRDEPRPDEQAPWPDEVYLRLSVITCTRCKPTPTGICTCGIECEYPACMFDHAVLTGLNRDELDFLDGKRGLPQL
jgi:hypothetical protein